MADPHWPLDDDMPLEGFTWRQVENGDFADMEQGAVRASPKAMGIWVEYVGDYDMSYERYHGIFLPWWQARAALGGTSNGVTPFVLRDPSDLKPYRWIRQKGQKMNPVRDGVGYIVNLPLLRLPS